MLPIIWFLVVSGISILVWRLMVRDKIEKENRKNNKKR